MGCNYEYGLTLDFEKRKSIAKNKIKNCLREWWLNKSTACKHRKKTVGWMAYLKLSLDSRWWSKDENDEYLHGPHLSLSKLYAGDEQTKKANAKAKSSLHQLL